MCLLQEIYRTCKNGMSSINHVLQEDRKFHFLSSDMASTEPFFYDSAYKLVKKEYALPIDTNGRCITAKNVCTSDEIPRYSAKEPPMKWECSSECKIIGDSDVCTIIDLAAAFQKPMR